MGPANRLASAAARRAADSPGTSYNPLFIYSSPGLGKSHLLVATSHRAKKVNPDLRIAYLSLETSLEDIVRALEGGQEDGGLPHLEKLDMLLLDDVELLAGREIAEEYFVRVLTAPAQAGAQLVLGSSRAPSDIKGLDHRLVNRFSGGLIVDIAVPEFETRVDIVRRKVEDRAGDLAPGIAELIGRVSVRSVRELSGIINRVMAIQELEGRLVSQAEVPELLSKLDLKEGDEFGAFVDELAEDVATTVEVAEAPWRRILREALDAGEREGYNCGRLRHLLEQQAPPPDTRRIVERFTADIDRLRGIRAELKRLGDPWPEAALGVLRDPDRMEEAEALLTSALELARPYPPVPEPPDVSEAPALEAPVAQALKVLESSGGRQSPLYLWSAENKGARAVLAHVGQAFADRDEEGHVAFISVRDFAEDFIRALTAGVAGAWRERWWKVELLLVERLQDLSSTERARDELFHLFEAVQRSGGKIVLAGDRPPSRIGGIDQRMRARLEGGLVLEIESDDVPDLAPPPADPIFDPVLGGHVLDEDSLADFPVFGPGTEEGPPPAASGTDLLDIDPSSFEALDDLLGAGSGAVSQANNFRTEPETGRGAPDLPDLAPADGGGTAVVEPGAGSAYGRSTALAGWRPTNEEVVWVWPRIEDLLVEEYGPKAAAGSG